MLVWSSEKPTKPGYYWVRSEGEGVTSVPIIREVVVHDGTLRVLIGWVWLAHVEEEPDDMYWAGPIPLPEEPTP